MSNQVSQNNFRIKKESVNKIKNLKKTQIANGINCYFSGIGNIIEQTKPKLEQHSTINNMFFERLEPFEVVGIVNDVIRTKSVEESLNSVLIPIFCIIDRSLLRKNRIS